MAGVLAKGRQCEARKGESISAMTEDCSSSEELGEAGAAEADGSEDGGRVPGTPGNR